MDEFDRFARQSIDGLLEPLGLDPKRDRTKAYEVLAVQLRRSCRPRSDLVDAIHFAEARAEKAERELAQFRNSQGEAG